MTNIVIGASTRFDGDFSLVAAPGVELSPDEKSYVEKINEILGGLASPAPEVDEDILRLLQKHRLDLAKQLGEAALKISGIADEGERSAECKLARDASLRYHGMYIDRCDLVRQSPFSIYPLRDKDNLINDIEIRVLDVKISSEKQDLKVEIDRALDVIRAVLLERMSQKRFGKNDETKRRLHEYLRSLVGVARVGLVNSDLSQVTLGRLALAGLKDHFVTREAGFVKNFYVFWLGVWATVAVLASVAAFFITPEVWPGSVGDKHRAFFLLFAGAAIGTWLSFSLRRTVLSFNDLAVLEEDRLKPKYRILFMIALTLVIGLLFHTRAIEVTVGDFKTDMGQGAAALLIGTLCGIAERAMALAVARRANDFAAGVGGSSKSS